MWSFKILVHFMIFGYSTLEISFYLYEKDAMYYPHIESEESETILGCARMCYKKLDCVYFGFHVSKKLCKLYDRHINSWQTSVVKENESEWEIFYIHCIEENIASSKNVSSSTVYSNKIPSYATDGRISTYFETGTGDFTPWFLVDLAAVYTVNIIVVLKGSHYPELPHDVNYEFYLENPQSKSDADPYCCASTIGFYTTGRTIIRCSPSTRGRYLKIYSFHEYLYINELEIYPRESWGRNTIRSTKCRQPIEGENIALNKVTSSTNSISNVTVDGNRDNYYTCIRTGSALNPSWSVDLENQYAITSISIYSRSYYDLSDAEKFSNLTIYVYPDQFDSSAVCVYLPGVFGRTKRTVTCTNTTVGRHVAISKPTPELSICEVEVTGVQKLR